MGIGQSLVGVFSGFMLAPARSEMVSVAEELYPERKDDPEVERLTVLIQNFAIGLAMIIGPIFGAFVTGAVGFRMTTDIMVIILCFHAVFYFALADGKAAFRSTCGRVQNISKFEANDNDFLKVRSDQNLHSSSGEL